MSTHPGRGGVGTVTCLPHQGDGMVARLPGDVFLVAGGDPDAQEHLLEVCSSVVRSGGSGRDLVRALATSVTSTGDQTPPFAVLAVDANQLIVFVHGGAEVEAPDVLSISGRESLAWVDRVVPWPLASVTASVPGPRRVTLGAYNLRDGAVPGAGLTLVTAGGVADVGPAPGPPTTSTRGSGAPGPPGPDGEGPGSPTPSEHSAPGPAGGQRSAVPAKTPSGTGGSGLLTPRPGGDRPRVADPAAPVFESVLIGLPQAAGHAPASAALEPARAPLPIAGEPRTRDQAPDRPRVRGVYCKNNHFNDPHALFCAVCGINMVQKTPVLTDGPRPPLGVLVLDDGSVFQLDDEYVLGRDPRHDEAVTSGRRRPLVINDAFNTVSRAHARVELREWDVVLFDNGSANGTFAAAEGEVAWQHVPPGMPYVLRAGSRVLIGRRTLIFNTHRSA